MILRMEPIEAQKMAVDLMSKHGLDGWTLKFDRAVARVGCCYHDRKLITLSKPLTELNTRDLIRNTILHEIAHALVGHEAGHGPVWERMAKAIGCDGNRCAAAVLPKQKWKAVCSRCGYTVKRNRRTNDLACLPCCDKYNNGKWTDTYLFTWYSNDLKGEMEELLYA